MSPLRRTLHTVAVILLSLISLLILSVMGFSLAVSTHEGAEQSNLHPWFAVVGLSALIVLIACILAIIKKARWYWLVLATALNAAGLFYLAVDDALPAPESDLGPRVGADDPGYQVLMWMSEKSAHSRLDEATIASAAQKKITLPDDTKNWPAHIAQNRQLISTLWEIDQLGPAWINAINQTPPQGIWPQAAPNLPYINFNAIRSIGQRRIAYACLLATEGRRDEAISLLIPWVTALHHYQRTGTQLLNQMIANVLLKQSHITLSQIISLGKISPATRDQLKTVLRDAPPIQQQLRNALIPEGDFINAILNQIDSAKSVGALNLAKKDLAQKAMQLGAAAFVLNKNRSTRLVRDELNATCILAETRELEAFESRGNPWGRDTRLKNPVGRLVVLQAFPAYSKSIRMFWEQEDRRLALLKELSPN